MKKCGKTALSLLLSVSMGVATVTPVMASPARGEPELNPLVAVIEKVNSGDTLNLTEEGTLDWVHITGKEINRKSGDEELIQWENLQIRNRSSDIFIIRQCLKMQELSRQKPGTNLCPIMKS